MQPELILVVEDEDAIRANIARLLRIEGFEVVAAANGKEALACATERLPALVLSDVTMPEMDGHGLLAALRAVPATADIPFVFLTARADHSDMREGMEHGADDYLIKPCQRDELLRAVRGRLERSRVQAQKVHRLSRYDTLTELPNRAFLLDCLGVAMPDAQKEGARLAVLLVGLDGLKHVNHSLGIEVGDRVLQMVGERLHAAVHGGVFVSTRDAVAKLDGDRFAMLIEGFGDDDYLESFARSAAERLSRPYQSADQDIFLTASLGVATMMSAGDQPDDILRRAEVALDAAKAAGPQGLVFFSDSIQRLPTVEKQEHN